MKNIQDDYRWAPAKTVQAADKLIELKKNKGPWEVIAEIIKIWRSTHPTQYDSYIINLEGVKQSRKVTSVGGKQFSGVSKDKSGAYLQYKLDIPEKVVYMIRTLYNPEELPMDKKFYQTWAKKFPKMVVSTKV